MAAAAASSDLETVLRRYLKRAVRVIQVDSLPTQDAELHQDGAWSTERRTIAASLQGRRIGLAANSELAEFAARETRAPRANTFACRLWVATVVIGKRAFLPLTEAECFVIAAAVGMASLLFENARLCDVLRVAVVQAETTVKRLVESQRRHGRRGRSQCGVRLAQISS